MRFKTDENLPIQIAELLRQNGHDAMTVHEQKMGGQPDPQVISVCQSEQRTLVTLDLDFSDLRRYSPPDYQGIIVLRPENQDVKSLVRLMNRVLQFLNSESPIGHLWIADEHQIRIR